MCSRKVNSTIQGISGIPAPSIILAMVHFLVTVFTDSFIFKNVDYLSMKRYYAIKAIVLLLLLFFWKTLFTCYQWLRGRTIDDKTKARIKYFCVYGGLLFVLLLLIWPGIWRWDDLHVLNTARYMEYLHWQHWLTSLFYMICLATIPFPGGVVLIQAVICAAIVSWIAYKIQLIFSKKAAWIFLLLMMLPAIVDSALFPLRPTLCGFLELLLLSSILFKWLEKSPVCVGQAIYWAGLTAVVSTWRSEAVIYLLLIPVLFLFFLRKKFHMASSVAFLSVLAIVAGSITSVQKQEPSDYDLTAIYSPLSAIIKTDFSSDNPQRDLEIIDQVISVDALQEMDGIDAYWAGHARLYDKQNGDALKKVYLKLVIRNMPSFLANQWEWFAKSNGLVKDFSNQLGLSPQLFDLTNRPIFDIFRDEFILNQPINKDLRSYIISVLECRNPADYEKTTLLYPVFYNVIPVLVVLLACFIWSLVKKHMLIAYLSAIILMKTGLIFATAPAGLFMYYFPAYICGIGLAVPAYCLLLKNRQDV